MFKDKLKLVDDVDIQICASGAFDEYPWGRVVFNMTLQFIQSQLKEKVAKVKRGKTKNEGKVVYETIKLYGFLLAIQYWLYDCIPILSSFYRKKVGSTMPKMNKWKAIIENPSFDEVAHIIFDSKVIYIVMYI